MRLRYTIPALDDLASILDGIAEFSPQAAGRVGARIQSLIEKLPRHPFIGRPTEDATLRRIVVSPYPDLVFYEPTEDEVVIHAVRHTARDPASMPGSG